MGTARCLEFQEREGMRKAALTLIQHGITRLIVIGGDGSLTGYLDLLQDDGSDTPSQVPHDCEKAGTI